MIPRLPNRFFWACRSWHVRPTRFVLSVSVRLQRLFLFEARDACLEYRRRRQFTASTSRFGTGQQSGSNHTPLGLHRIAEKIGAGYPVGTVFESRRPVAAIWDGRPNAAIAHRILWLDGLEPGFNRGGAVDTHARYIYIHGLADEPSLGRPASRGCVHLAAADLMPLFDLVPTGTLVWIEE
jgi:L,D-transpeptidase YbiS